MPGGGKSYRLRLTGRAGSVGAAKPSAAAKSCPTEVQSGGGPAEYPPAGGQEQGCSAGEPAPAQTNQLDRKEQPRSQEGVSQPEGCCQQVLSVGTALEGQTDSGG